MEIGRSVEECLKRWGLDNIMTITVDNASSNDITVTYLKNRLYNNVLNEKYLHMRCVAHIINLIVKDGLKEYDDSIKCVRAAIKYVRHSSSRLDEFVKAAKDESIDCNALMSLDCPTRWNSTFEMLNKAEKFELCFICFSLVLRTTVCLV